MVVDFLMFSLHQLRSMYAKGWKFQESSFKNEGLVAVQSFGLKAEKRLKIIGFNLYQGKFGTQTGRKSYNLQNSLKMTMTDDHFILSGNVYKAKKMQFKISAPPSHRK
jgi:hypothetical protein